MKDRENVLRELDEVDNMIFILADLAQKRSVDTNEAVRRLKEIRAKIKFVQERVSIS
jgi:hypothetical protein